MKKQILFGLAGLLAGIVLTGLVAYKAAPGMMMNEAVSAYDFATSVDKLEAVALEMGWKIPKVHDLKETMEVNGYKVNNAKVFELCHPDHAYKILKLDNERIVSSMMPCRISIYEKSDGRTYVSWMNTSMMGNMMGGAIAEVMGVATRESEQMIKSITAP